MVKTRKELANNMKIRILFGRLEAFAILKDTLTACVIWKALPIEGAVKKWGEEIYFPIELDIREESDALTDVNAGDLRYWPSGRAVCIFFGRTPASHGAC